MVAVLVAEMEKVVCLTYNVCGDCDRAIVIQVSWTLKMKQFSLSIA